MLKFLYSFILIFIILLFLQQRKYNFKIKNTKNLSFNFIQTIDDKNEKGNCIIEYPKKIFCEYNVQIKKLLFLMVNL